MKKTFLLTSKNMRYVFLVFLAGLFSYESNAQCGTCTGTPLTTNTINTSGTYCVNSAISNLTINAPNVTVINKSTISGSINFYNTNAVLNNCGTINLTSSLQLFNNAVVRNYGTLTANPQIIVNQGSTFHSMTNSTTNTNNFTINGAGIVNVAGRVNASTTVNYGTINGQGGSWYATSFSNYASIAGTISLPNGRPNPNYGTISSTVTYYSCTDVNKTGTWSQKASFPSSASRFSSLVFSHNGKIYAGLGVAPAPSNTLFYVYDPATNVWSQLPSFPVASSTEIIGQAKVIGNKAYFVTINQCTLNTWEFDLTPGAANPWVQKANPPSGVGYGAFTFTVNNKFYIGAGTMFCHPGFPHNGFLEYNPATNVWVTKNYAPAGGGFTAFERDGKAYIVGGNDWGPVYKYTKEYNPVNDTWIARADFANFGLGNSTSFGLCNYGFLYYANTDANNNTYHQTWRYNAASNIWQQAATFTGQPRLGAEFVTADGKGYLFGGYNYINGNSVSLNDLWVYNPAAGTALREADLEVSEENAVSSEINAISMAPNPANEFTNIKYNLGDKENGTLKIYTAANAVPVFEQSLNDNQGNIELNTQKFSNGVYFIVVQTGAEVVGKQKLVIAN